MEGLSGVQTKAEIHKMRLMEIADHLKASGEELERFAASREDDPDLARARRQVRQNQAACDRALRVQKSLAYAVAERIDVLKRHESTLRLHHKLWEAARVHDLVPPYEHIPDPERDRFDVTSMDDDQ
jgi:hypothetical protein